MKLTRKVITQICELVECHASWEEIARGIGVSARTLRVWRAKGQEKEKGIYYELRIAIEQTRDKTFLEYVKSVQNAALNDQITIIEKDNEYDSQGKLVRQTTRKIEPADAKVAERMLERLAPDRFIRPRHHVVYEVNWREEVKKQGMDPDDFIQGYRDELDKQILFDDYQQETDPERKAELEKRAKELGKNKES